MGKFSPLRYLCLLAFSLVASWFLLALLFLFFPVLPYDWDLEPPQRVATSPETLTRAYRVDDWFPYWESNVDVQELREVSRRYFAVDLQLNLSPSSSKAWFVIGGVNLDLHAYWDRVDKTPRPLDEGPATYISEQIKVPAKFGDRDGILPPWFWQADACVLFWDIHHDTAMIPLRLKVSDHRNGQMIEILPDSNKWDRFDNSNLPTTEPLLTLYSDDQFRRNVDVRFLYAEGVEHTSLSRTFPIRRAIQSIIVPTGLFVYNHTGFVAIGLIVILQAINLAFKILVLYALVVFVCWIAKGKPPFGPWVQSYWMTRLVVAKLPTLNRDPTVWEQEPPSGGDGVGSERRPQPLRGISDFFRSASPLDDLFVTFDVTKRLVEPITFRRTRANSGERAQVTSVPNNFKFNVSHHSSKQGQANQQDEPSDLEKGNAMKD